MFNQYETDFTLTKTKKIGGGKKQTRERKKENKHKQQTCYSSKHVRAKEKLLQNGVKNNGKK